MVASTMAYSMSGPSEQALNNFTNTSALRQSLKRRNAVLQFPKCAGRSRHGEPVRTIQSTASMKAVVTAAASGIHRLTETMRFHLRPLGVCQYESFHLKLDGVV